jgi:hypothetical protein
MVSGFYELLQTYCDPTNFTTYQFRRLAQPRYPTPSFKSIKVDREGMVEERNKERKERQVRGKVVTPAAGEERGTSRQQAVLSKCNAPVQDTAQGRVEGTGEV